VYRGELTGDPVVDGFAEVVADCGIPRLYPDELLAGMAMDAAGHRYRTDSDLQLYCYRVAGVVGLMMSHVMGVARADALRSAADLGIAMQLTNICRDVREDWDRGRLYIPESLLAEVGAGWLPGRLGRPLPVAARAPLAACLARLLERADHAYRSGDAGLDALAPRCQLAIGAARRIYAAIGDVIAARECDVFAPRAVVSTRRKLALAAAAAAAAAARAPRGVGQRYRTDLEPVTLEGLSATWSIGGRG
jgi:phytoene synthase